MRKSALFILLLVVINSIFAQEADFGDTQLYYTKEISGGAMLHTTGFGANFRYTKRITGFKRLILTAEYITQKHSKEQKIESSLKNYRGYVLGKINSFSNLKPGVGFEKIIFRKDAKNGVQIAYNIQGGPSLGLLKPIFLDVGYPTINKHEGSPSTERYNPDIHTQDRIFGKSHFLKGTDELNIKIGLHSKFGFTFEYSPSDEITRSIETGIMLDAFAKPVPIMAYTNNKQFFLNYYVTFNIGKKYLE